MSKVLVSVTIGIGELIHKSKADARGVSWGFTSFIFFFLSCMRYANIRKNFRLKSYTGENIIVLAL